jgi:hypothetical protein
MQKFEVGKEIIIPNIKFQEDKPNILTESYRELDNLANVFIQNPHCIIQLKGHVDVTYKSEMARTLSQYRVNAIKDYLLSKKVNPAQLISPQGMGRQYPLMRNPSSADERRMNNRITYTVMRIDAAKELEYSRLQAANPVAQTNTRPQTGATRTGATQQPAATTQTRTPTQPQQAAQTQQPQRTTQSSSGFAVLNDGPYIIQVASSGSLDLKDPNFLKITKQLGLEVKYKLVDGKYKYFVGFFSTLTEAKDVVAELNKIGIKDTFPRAKY